MSRLVGVDRKIILTWISTLFYRAQQKNLLTLKIIFSLKVDRLHQQKTTMGSTPVNHENISEAVMGLG